MGQVSQKNLARSMPIGEIRDGKRPIKEDEVAIKRESRNTKKKL